MTTNMNIITLIAKIILIIAILMNIGMIIFGQHDIILTIGHTLAICTCSIALLLLFFEKKQEKKLNYDKTN